MRSTICVLLLAGCSIGGDSLGQATQRLANQPSYCDFNGDRYADLAVGAPNETFSSSTFGGVVHVLYGAGAGIDANGGSQYFTASQLSGASEEDNEEMGASMSCGDFDNDGYGDLVIGRPESTRYAGGAVHVIYGSASKLVLATKQTFSQDTIGMVDVGEAGDDWGRTLVTGDFNGDGYADLAVGAPQESIGTAGSAGQITVVFGSANGLAASGSQARNQAHAGETPEAGDLFGEALAAGDFDGDGDDDLAIGAPGETIYIPNVTFTWAGSLHAIRGTSTGLASTGLRWDRFSNSVPGNLDEEGFFAMALAAGDFNSDGRDDLAVGNGAFVQDSSGNWLFGAGDVNLFDGSATSLLVPDSLLLHQNVTGVYGTAEAYDFFGSSLATGDFDGDGYTDLAVGAEGEDVGSASAAGAVHAFYGSANGIAISGNQQFYQGSGASGTVGSGDAFGAALVAGSFNGDEFVDIAIGVPGETVAGLDNAGSVHAIYGAPFDGLGWAEWVVNQNTGTITDACEAGDKFGASLGSR